MWPDWAIFEKSRLQIFFKSSLIYNDWLQIFFKSSLIDDDFLGSSEKQHSLVATTLAPFGATFISPSGHMFVTKWVAIPRVKVVHL